MRLYENELVGLNESEKQKTFDFMNIAGIIHECEHIVADRPRAQGTTNTVDDLVANEKHAWALTCKYTLGPCIEKYGYQYFPEIRGYYTVWLKAGLDENSPVWDTFIRSTYQNAKTVPDDGNMPKAKNHIPGKG